MVCFWKDTIKKIKRQAIEWEIKYSLYFTISIYIDYIPYIYIYVYICPQNI